MNAAINKTTTTTPDDIIYEFVALMMVVRVICWK